VSVIKAFFGLGKLPQVVKYFEFQSFQDVNKMGGALRAIREEAKTSGAQLTKNQQKYLDDQQRQVEMVFEQLQQPTTQTGIRGTQSAKIIDMQGKEIPKGSKIMGGKAIDDTKMIDDAIENSSPGFAKGDTKYNAELVAEDLAERMGLVYDDLDTKQKIDIYGKAYDRLSKRNFQVKEFEKRIAEKLGAQNKQSVGNLRKKKLREDISKLDDKIEARKLQLEQRGVEDFETDDLFNKLDEQRNDLNIKLDFEDMVDPEDMAEGGRAGFKIGSIDKGRRAFLKAAAGIGAGIGALKAGALKMFGKETAKNIPQVVTTPPVAGKPAWFDSVVNKVIAEGDDVTKQFAYKDRMQVNTKQISPTEEVTVYRDLDDGSVRINYGAKMRIDETKPYEKGNIRRASNDPDQVDLIVREGEVIEPVIEGKYKNTVGRKTQSSFEASEAEPRSVGGPEDADIEFDGERIVNNVDDLMQDVSTLEEFGTGKKLIGDKAAKAKKKKEDYQKFTEDQMEQAEYLETKYGPGPEPDDFASGGLAGMLGE
jgi:hypothetical protein